MAKWLKLVFVATIAGTLGLSVTGCDNVLGLVFKPDLTITEVTPLKSGDELTGVRIIFENHGIVGVEDVRYAVVLSTDTTISLATDTTVYEGEVSLERNGQRQVDLSGPNDIEPWMMDNGMPELESVPYYLGAFIDVEDDVTEKEETNNEMASDISFEMGGEGPGNSPSLAVELYDASDLASFVFMYGVFAAGADTDLEEPIAIGSNVIESGSAYAVALLADGSDEVWFGQPGDSYDVYAMVDMNHNADYDSFVDYHRDVIHIAMDEDGVVEQVSRSTFGGRGDPHPAEFGVYSSANHTIYVEPEIVAGDCVLNLDYPGPVASYDGSPVMEAGFTQDPIGWIGFRYPTIPDTVMDISNSNHLVFYIDDNDDVGSITSVSFIFFSPDSGFPGLTVELGGPYMSATGVGPQLNWDEYTIPLGEIGGGGNPFDPTAMESFKFGGTNGDGTIYFDNIHFTHIE